MNMRKAERDKAMQEDLEALYQAIIRDLPEGEIPDERQECAYNAEVGLVVHFENPRREYIKVGASSVRARLLDSGEIDVVAFQGGYPIGTVTIPASPGSEWWKKLREGK